MATQQTIAGRADIRRTVEQIVDKCQPEKVILFGSYAEGGATGDSDVDLLVILDTKEHPLHAAAGIAAAIDHPYPMDIVVFTPAKWRASLRRGGVFARQVVERGLVLYEAGNR